MSVNLLTLLWADHSSFCFVNVNSISNSYTVMSLATVWRSHCAAGVKEKERKCNCWIFNTWCCSMWNRVVLLISGLCLMWIYSFLFTFYENCYRRDNRKWRKLKFVTTLTRESEATLLPSSGMMIRRRHMWSVMVCMWYFRKTEILTSMKISLLYSKVSVVLHELSAQKKVDC